MIMKHLTMRALLLALVGCCCLALAAQSQAPAGGTQFESTTSPSVISGLLREQLSRRNTATVTTTTQSSRPAGSSAGGLLQPAIETEVPSSRPSAPATTQKPQASVTTISSASSREQQASSTQFQVLRPVSSSSLMQKLPIVEATTTTTPTTTTTTTTTSTTTSPPTSTERAQRDAPACQHNNQTYQIGQKWNEDCDQACECVLDRRQFGVPLAISACRPRCPISIDPPGDNCRQARSSKDPCCLEWQCELEAKFAPPTSPVAPTTLITTTQTERGQLNMSTTEIRMPSSSPTTQAAQPTTTTTAAPPTTPAATTISSSRTSTTAVPATLTPRRTSSRAPAPATTVRSQPAPATTTSASSNQLAATNSVAPRRGAGQQAAGSGASTSVSSREPRQGGFDSSAIARGASPRFSDFSGMTRDIGDLSPVAAEAATPADMELPEGVESPKEVEPALVDLCIVGNYVEGYEINQTFSDECERKCRCVFRDEPRDKTRDISVYETVNLRNDTQPIRPTEIRCGWPERCAREALAKQLAPSADCAEPVLLAARNACDCPTLSCTSSNNSPKLQPQGQSLSPKTKAKKQGCKSRNNPAGKLAPGESFADECHAICRCSDEGQLTCEALVCPTEPPSDLLCAEWELDPSFRQNATLGQCCAEFVCKRPAIALPSTSSTSTPPATSSPISSRSGEQSAQKTTTTTTATPITTTATAARSQAEEEGAELKPRPKSCTLLGKVIADGERVPEEIQARAEDEPCERPACVCQDGNIVCQSSTCSQGLGPAELDRVNVTLVNGTTVEVLIGLPKSLVGHYGYFELNYTHTPVEASSESPDEEPPAEAVWQLRPKIGTANEMLSADGIKYYWPGLIPNHKYWFQVALIYSGPLRIFISPIRSPIQSMVIPAEAAVADTTSAIPSSSQASSTAIPTTTTTSATTTTTTTTTPRPAPTRVIHPIKTTNSPRLTQQTNPTRTTTITTTTSTSSSSSTTTASPDKKTEAMAPIGDGRELIIPKKPLDKDDVTPPPCTSPKVPDEDGEIPPNNIETAPRFLPSWHQKLQFDIHETIQRNAWHLLVALFVMTTLFVIVLYSYCKKVRVVAPITTPGHHHNGFPHHPHHHHQSAYDNPTFTKLVSYYGNQPHVLLVDESNQNFDNMAKQKNLEVDKSSPLHSNNNNINNNGSTPNNNNHHTTSVHHRNGRQNLI